MNPLVKMSLSVATLALFLPIPDLQSATIINQTFSGPFPATITGSLPDQGAVLEEAFSLTSTSNLTIFTSSYATGGFEPNITLYDSTGKFVADSMVPGSMPAGKADPTTGQALDTHLEAGNVAAGSYTVTLTDWELNQSPTATNLSDGFNANLGSGTTFVDVLGNARSGAFDLVISPTPTAAAPEPGTFWLSLAIGIATVLGSKCLGFMQSTSQSYISGENHNG